jgi:hypothetical protein
MENIIHTILCIKFYFKRIIWPFYAHKCLPDPERRFIAGVTCRQEMLLLLDTWSHLWYIQGSVFVGMLTPPELLIQPLVYSSVRVYRDAYPS